MWTRRLQSCDKKAVFLHFPSKSVLSKKAKPSWAYNYPTKDAYHVHASTFFSILHSFILSSGRTPEGFLWLHNSSGLSYSICYSNLPALRFVWLLSVTCVRVCFSATPRLCVLFNALTMGLFTASSITRLTVVGLFVDDVEWIEYVLSGLLERERQSERKITTN